MKYDSDKICFQVKMFPLTSGSDDIFSNFLCVPTCTGERCRICLQFVNPSCGVAYLLFFSVYDSLSKYPGGIFSGEVAEFGNYDQCMSISSEGLGINGAYAVANIRFYLADGAVSDPLDHAKAKRERPNVTTYY